MGLTPCCLLSLNTLPRALSVSFVLADHRSDVPHKLLGACCTSLWGIDKNLLFPVKFLYEREICNDRPGNTAVIGTRGCNTPPLGRKFKFLPQIAGYETAQY
jgi:hypothetical protein